METPKKGDEKFAENGSEMMEEKDIAIREKIKTFIKVCRPEDSR